jgi:hypothetical protein
MSSLNSLLLWTIVYNFVFVCCVYYSMSSLVETVARSQSATIQSVESEDEGRSIELSDEVRDMIDVPVEGESVEPAIDGRKRKSKTSEVWQYFLEVEVKKKAKW